MTPIDLESDSELSYAAQEGLALVAQAKTFVVKDQRGFDAAALFARNLKGHIDRIKAMWAPIKARSRAAWQGDVDDEKAMLEGPQAALEQIAGALGAFERQQRELRAAEEKAAAALAEQARATTGAPVVVAAPAVPVPTAEGVSFRSTWKASVTDKDALIVACCPSPCCQKGKKVATEALEPNMKLLDDLARSQKGNLEKMVPGVVGVEQRGMATKGK